jgi:hypothetical protein
MPFALVPFLARAPISGHSEDKRTIVRTSSWFRFNMSPFSAILQCSAIALLLLLSTQFTTSLAQDDGGGGTCISVDSPNPIAQQYPTVVTGNLNGTTLIVPIPVRHARQLIPKQYRILENAYRSLLPNFPPGMYPMMVTAKHDHDLQLAAYNLSIPDFTVSTSSPIRAHSWIYRAFTYSSIACGIRVSISGHYWRRLHVIPPAKHRPDHGIQHRGRHRCRSIRHYRSPCRVSTIM